MLDSGFCLGDPALVHRYIDAPHLWNSPVPSLEPGSRLVYGGDGPGLDPHSGCVQADTSGGKLLEGGYGA